jgi:beta-glucosidase/6-phospho-beta-glucosidase/beta-galactosidase
MGRTLGDRVKHWITFNEPFAFIVIGHAFGSTPGTHRSAARVSGLAPHRPGARRRRAGVARDGARAVVGIAGVDALLSGERQRRPMAAARRYDGFQSLVLGAAADRRGTRPTSSSASGQWRRARRPATPRA